MINSSELVRGDRQTDYRSSNIPCGQAVVVMTSMLAYLQYVGLHRHFKISLDMH